MENLPMGIGYGRLQCSMGKSAISGQFQQLCYIYIWYILWTLDILQVVGNYKIGIVAIIEGSLEVKLPTNMHRWKSRAGKSQRGEVKK